MGPAEKDEGKGRMELLVQIPERTVTQDLGSDSCPFHREHLGLEVHGSQGHSRGL